MTSFRLAKLSGMRWASCKCWLFENIFIPQHNLHLRFEEYPDFVESNSQLFTSLGLSQSALDDAFQVARMEHYRRKEAELLALENKLHNLKIYMALENNAFVLKKREDFVEPFHRLCEYADNEKVLTEEMLSVAQEFEGVNEVYGFPLFSSNCLQRLNDELDSFRALGCRTIQPNTMNRSGILLSEIPGSQACCQKNPESLYDPGGADIDLMSSLLKAGVGSVLTRLYPDVGPFIDSYRVFTVEYSGPSGSGDDNLKDFDLAPHYDNSELTINICLDLAPVTEHHYGGELFFCHRSPRDNIPWDRSRDGFAKLVVHRPGWALVHRGSHIHGILPFQPAPVPTHRRSLICWLRSSTTRASHCPRCSERPQLAPMQVWHQGRFLDCTDLPQQAYDNGDYVRVGFADGFQLPPSHFSCHVI